MLLLMAAAVVVVAVASPLVGDTIQVLDIANDASTNAIIIGRNGGWCTHPRKTGIYMELVFGRFAPPLEFYTPPPWSASTNAITIGRYIMVGGAGSAVAAFLVVQGDYSYLQTSSSVVGGDPWTDSGWCWHPLFDLKCGAPKGVWSP